MNDLRIEKRFSQINQCEEWVVWQNGIKLKGFWSLRSANAFYKKLLKDPTYRD